MQLLMPMAALPRAPMRIAFLTTAVLATWKRQRPWLLTTQAFPLAASFHPRSSVIRQHYHQNHQYKYSGGKHPCCITRQLMSGQDNIDAAPETDLELHMEHLYQEWTLEQDELLWNGFSHEGKSTTQLAVLLGRGLGGVQARLAKLQDVSSSAYHRLFVTENILQGSDDDIKKKKKLIPASEVLRRIQWDYHLDEQDFSIVYYDRVEQDEMESPLTAPNDNISGQATRLVDALPEHRITAIKYRERVVWDRQQRMDYVFGSGERGNGITIEDVIQSYDEWKEERDREIQLLEQRRSSIQNLVRQVLGLEGYEVLEELVVRNGKLQPEPNVPVNKVQVEAVVEKAQNLFRQAREDPSSSLDPSLIPMNDYDALDILSEWMVLLPNASSELKSILLQEINALLESDPQKPPSHKGLQRPLPTFKESDLTETFIRGSGPGGQKINKTSNRVVLIHNPTNIHVECQETRSLPQNRKIARKRLREKLDEYVNGKQSKTQIKAQMAASKKAKAKQRNRARQKRKKQEQEQEQEE